MFGWLFARRKGPDAAPLLAALVAGAREPAPFAQWGVADTFEGRFEYLALLTTLVLERLAGLGAGGQALSQELVDAIFTHLDDALRRSGVSDLAVGKRMKKLARSFYGRIKAYREGILAGDEASLRAALARNLYAGALAPEAVPAPLLARLAAHRAALEAASLEALSAGAVFTKGE